MATHTIDLLRRRPSLRSRFTAWRTDRSRRIMADSLECAVEDPEAAGTLRGAVNEALLAFDAHHETYPPEA